MSDQLNAINFEQFIDPKLLAQLKKSDLEIDPAKLFSGLYFSLADFQQAKTLQSQINVVNHDFKETDNNNFLFYLELANGFIHFKIEIAYTFEKINKIFVDSNIRNLGNDAIKIVALNVFLEKIIHEKPIDQTNSAAKILLQRFKIEKKELPITFQAQFEAGRFGEQANLSFKIGQGSHLYKVQNLQDLINFAQHHTPVKLGKYFNRAIDVQEMDKDSQAWFNLVETIVENNRSLEIARNNYYSPAYKYLPMTKSLVDQVDVLLTQGNSLYVNNAKLDYEVSNKKLPLKIKTDAQYKIVKVNIDFLLPIYDLDDLIEGHHNYYYVNNYIWRKYQNVDPSFFHRYGIKMGDELTFGSNTIQEFGRAVMPELKESNSFAITGMKKLKDILPPEAAFVFKLDFKDQEIILIPIVKYGNEEFSLLEKIKADQVREVEKEKAIAGLVQKIGFIKKSKDYVISLGESEKVEQLLADGLNQLKKRGRVETTAAFHRLLSNAKSKFNLSLGIRLGQNMLELDLRSSELTDQDIELILRAYQERKHYILLKDQLRTVDSPDVEDLARIMKDLGLSLNEVVKGKMAIPVYRAFYLDQLLKEQNQLKFTSDTAFKKLLDDLRRNNLPTVKTPREISKILRPYQKEGVKWLNTLIQYNLGGLLADEMGLGKTLQIISVILTRKSDRPSLIVVPASVVYNWQAEFGKFAPKVKVSVLGGDKKQRISALQHLNDAKVLITSYDSLRNDLEEYQNINFDLEVIDEAQNIKNARAGISKAVKVIKADHRIALTGTPIENNLSELWSIFDYLMPGFLGKYDYFKNNYEKPIIRDEDEKIEKKLNQIVAPFILRRLKKDVLRDLPAKREEIIYAKMTGQQEKLYQAQTQKLLLQLKKQNKNDFKKQKIQVLAAITKLREVCCDPRLIYNDYHGRSTKLKVSLELIKDSLESGHKILLFSQFTSMLDIIKKQLKKIDAPTYVITGATPKKKRQELIKDFNKLDRSAIFLISLKAGGTGINLTSADVVIHYDPWWNQAAENQATDRAHRIGQKHDVQIYKIVAKNTIEEKIIELQKRKKKLSEAILSGDKLSASSLDKDDLFKILER